MTSFLITASVTMLLTTVPAAGTGAELPPPALIRLGGNEYRLYQSAQRRITDEEVRRVDEAFNRTAAALYARLNVYRPPAATIVLAADAGLFYRLTGADWRTAGLFEPVREIFYFQNPRSLMRLKTLDRVITHEVCHCLVRGAMTEDSSHGDPEARRWLEESFCEALSPGGEDTRAAIAPQAARLTDVTALAAWLNDGINAKAPPTRAAAHALARAWGQFLVRTHGDRAFLTLLIKRQRREWETDYRTFRTGMTGP